MSWVIPALAYAPTIVAYAPTLIAAGAAIRKTVDTVAWVHGWYVWTQTPAPAPDENDAWQWVEPAASDDDSGDRACDAFELASL